jgi:hypothetical protein
MSRREEDEDISGEVVYVMRRSKGFPVETRCGDDIFL